MSTVSSAAPHPAASVVKLALPALMLGATAIGFAPIFVRLSEIGPVATGFWRLALAWPLLWVWMLWEQRQARAKGMQVRRPQTVQDWVRLSIPGLFFAADLAVWHIAITLTTVTNATLLANFAPVFVALFAWILFSHRPTLTFVVGMVMAMVGAITLMGDSLSVSRDHLSGDALGLLTSVFYAGYILSVGRLRSLYSTATIMTWSAVSNILILSVVSWAMGESLWPQSAYAWSVLIGLALISHVAGQSLITFALAHLPPAFSSVSLLWQPACAALLAWLLLGESMSPWQGIGGLIVLAGILIARRASQKV